MFYFYFIAHKWCEVVVLVLPSRWDFLCGLLIERCHIYSSLPGICGRRYPSANETNPAVLISFWWKLMKAFGVHWYTSHVITSDYLLVTYKYLTENYLLWHLLIFAHPSFCQDFLMVDIFCVVMYVMVLKCNCTVSRKECNKWEFCIVYNCNYLCLFYHLYHINALYSVLFFFFVLKLFCILFL